ncbi:MAG: ABC transporter ATP-binding protein [Methylobacteriaceae bacterium]|jgi:sulfonate transport system ATP-binding protein|nr:ABC transporter ATP-binding protein [Methylobacteriaceae bacterium]
MLRIVLENLKKTYVTGGETIRALNDVSLNVRPGELLAIVGYSGCGKTTLLRHVAGLDRPDSGALRFFDGETPLNGPGRIGYVFQEPRLLPWKTVYRNLELALRHVDVSAAPDRIIHSVLALVGLAAFADAYPAELSGGMAQRASLARALCRDPDLLLMDEPLGALDALTRTHLQMEIAAIRQVRPVTTLFVTHDVSEAVYLADRVVVMDRGGIVHVEDVTLPYPRDPAGVELAEVKARVLDTIMRECPLTLASIRLFANPS